MTSKKQILLSEENIARIPLPGTNATVYDMIDSPSAADVLTEEVLSAVYPKRWDVLFIMQLARQSQQQPQPQQQQQKPMDAKEARQRQYSSLLSRIREKLNASVTDLTELGVCRYTMPLMAKADLPDVQRLIIDPLESPDGGGYRVSLLDNTNPRQLVISF